MIKLISKEENNSSQMKINNSEILNIFNELTIKNKLDLIKLILSLPSMVLLFSFFLIKAAFVSNMGVV